MLELIQPAHNALAALKAKDDTRNLGDIPWAHRTTQLRVYCRQYLKGLHHNLKIVRREGCRRTSKQCSGETQVIEAKAACFLDAVPRQPSHRVRAQRWNVREKFESVGNELKLALGLPDLLRCSSNLSKGHHDG